MIPIIPQEIDFENNYINIFGKITPVNKHEISLYGEIILYVYLSMKYKKEIEELSKKYSNPIKIDEEKHKLKYKLIDDLLIFSIDLDATPEQVKKEYCKKVCNIVDANPSLKDLLNYDFNEEETVLLYNSLKEIKKLIKDSENILGKSYDISDLLYSEIVNRYFKNKESYSLPYYCYELLKEIGYNSSVKSVYDNTVGFGNCFELNEDIEYYGIEVDPIIAKLSKIKMIINDKDPNIIFCGNALECGPAHNKKYDLTFSDIPFGISFQSIEQEFKYNHPDLHNNREIDFATGDVMLELINDALNHTNETGRCIVNCEISFLFRNKESRRYVRKQLVEKNLIHGILFFPSGTLPNSNAKIATLILDKNKKDDKIRLFNLAGFYEKDREINLEYIKEQEENKHKIWDIYFHQKESDERFVIISPEDIGKTDYDLFFDTYVKRDYTVKYNFAAHKKNIEELEKKSKDNYKLLLAHIDEMEQHI